MNGDGLLIAALVAAVLIWLLMLGLAKSAGKPLPARVCAYCGTGKHLFHSELFACTLCVHCNGDLVEMAPFEQEFRR